MLVCWCVDVRVLSHGGGLVGWSVPALSSQLPKGGRSLRSGPNTSLSLDQMKTGLGDGAPHAPSHTCWRQTW